MWRFKADGAAESSPVVVHGTVYLATPSASDPQGDDLYALDGASGRAIWKATVTWKARDDGAQDFAPPSPTVSGGVVYYGALNTLHALDARTGERLWKADPGSTPLGTPAVARGMVYIRELDNWPFTRLSAVDVKSGRRQWVSRMFSKEAVARAGAGTRTRTPQLRRAILSRRRLPVPPLRHACSICRARAGGVWRKGRRRARRGAPQESQTALRVRLRGRARR